MNKMKENRITFRNVNRKLITFTVFSMIQIFHILKYGLLIKILNR